MFIESGGDNLAATFSPELSDLTIYVIDVAAGEKIPRKGGPGITKSDLFVINKTDLAPYVGADLDVMRSDTTRMRTTRARPAALRDEQPEDAPGPGRGDRASSRAKGLLTAPQQPCPAGYRMPPMPYSAFTAPAPIDAPKRLASRSATFSCGV